MSSAWVKPMLTFVNNTSDQSE